MRHLLLLSAFAASSAWAVCGFTDGTLATSSVSADTTGQPDDVSPSCQPDNSGDVTFAWAPAISGRYLLSTDGATDTVLVLTDGADCATELACDDDSGPGFGSLLDVVVEAGVPYLVTVDTFSTTGGPFVLDVVLFQPATCPVEEDLGAQLVTRTGSSCGMGDDHHGASCGGGAFAEDVGWVWTAPNTGTFTFSARGSSYDTVLTLTDAADCNDELACHDDLVPLTDATSEITLDLVAGQQVAISMDGYGSSGTTVCGDYTFAITAGCPDTDGDGVCDAQDVCEGDDAVGDSDFDDVCDDLDFILGLSDSTPAPGSNLLLLVDHAAPGSQVTFLLSTRGTGIGPCHPTAGICSDLSQPVVVGSARANNLGRASLTLRVPTTAPVGATVAFQAAYVAPGDAAVSEVELAVVQ